MPIIYNNEEINPLRYYAIIQNAYTRAIPSIYIYIYIYIERERESDRQTDRQTEKDMYIFNEILSNISTQ